MKSNALPSALPDAKTLKGNRIALFGISADPPTVAHRKIVQHMAAQQIFDEIWYNY